MPPVFIDIMAVFMLNVCKFNGCGLTFKSLGHLIHHIEETHIDYDPRVVEQTELQQPTCIPLSYALRFLTDAARKERSKSANQGRLSQCNGAAMMTTATTTATTTTTTSASTKNRTNTATPTGSEAEEGDEFVSEPDDSNDSWTTSEEFSADFILRYGSRVINQNVAGNLSNGLGANSNNNAGGNPVDKPFKCPVPGCNKRYKNVNGIKYHAKNGHKKDGKVRKAFRCQCGKSYKTPSGLKNHAVIQHAGSAIQNGKASSSKYDHHHHHHHHYSHRDNIPKMVSNAGVPTRIGKQALAKAKVAAIEDHGYMKSEKPMISTDTSGIGDCDDEDLGILTPASTPPLPSQSPAKNDSTTPSQRHDGRSLQKYLANVVVASAAAATTTTATTTTTTTTTASYNPNQQRRSTLDCNN